MSKIKKSLDKKHYLDWTLLEFLDVISDKPRIYCMSFTNDNNIENDEFLGTKKQFLEQLKTIETDNYAESIKHLRDIIKSVENLDEFYSSLELTDMERYNYLKKITDNFNKDQVLIVLNNVDLYLHSDYYERINPESLQIFIDNGWDIPKYENSTVYNYAEMRKRTHNYSGLGLLSVIGLLKSKMQSLYTISETDEPETIYPDYSENKHPLIFTDEGYKLFTYFVAEYIGEDKKQIKVKYCEIYHYMNDYQNADVTRKYLLCTQLDYIDLIGKEYNTKLSKIQPQTLEYKDTNKHKLDQLRRRILK